MYILRRRLLSAACATVAANIWLAGTVHAAVLPEDRADLMYHSYNGGNVKVDGPSLLVRKKLGESVSVSGNYYVDMVTSASIDYQTLNGASGASPYYKEKRTQLSGGVDLLRGKTTYSFNYINSDESDYKARTASFGISEDMFGDLTTVSLGYTRAWDKVYKNVKLNGVREHDPKYGEQTADHRSYRVGVSQIVTKHFILGLNYESQSHEGQLGNPYRAIRFLSLSGTETYTDEIYPRTRTTNAIALDARYFWPFRAASHGSYRYFTDTWGIKAHTAEIGYTQPWRDWTFELSYRYHRQNAADFFSDLFPRPKYQNFMARDRNLSTMHDQTVHVGVTYDLAKVATWTHSWVSKGTVNLFYDHIQMNYADFRDARQSKIEFNPTPFGVGSEPFYSETANILRFFISAWF